jgi:cytochrome c oxidase subunit 4
MSEEHAHPNYMAIFVTMIVLTVLEVLAAKLYSFDGWALITLILLVGMAITKAVLVALYFMHLRFETKTFVVVVSAPLVFALILVLGLLPDIAFR